MELSNAPLGFSELCLSSLKNGSTDYTRRNLVNNIYTSTKTAKKNRLSSCAICEKALSQLHEQTVRFSIIKGAVMNAKFKYWKNSGILAAPVQRGNPTVNKTKYLQ